jgi:light-regulated signal transduction histidine kinase (bacteriophytochrome)
MQLFFGANSQSKFLPGAFAAITVAMGIQSGALIFFLIPTLTGTGSATEKFVRVTAFLLFNCALSGGLIIFASSYFGNRKNDSLMQKFAEVDTLRTELSRAQTALSQYADIASHDLREPIRIIIIQCQLVKKQLGSEVTPDTALALNYAIESAGKLYKLVKDLLTLSRIGSDCADFERLNVKEVVSAAEKNLVSTITPLNAAIAVGELPTITANRHLLLQLFEIFIGNALKYRTEEPPRIGIRADNQKTQWVFSVSDNGIGIDAAHHERIFTIFRRIHCHGAYDGNGIGLALCKTIVERGGGRIWVSSAVGKGATFYFTIPKQT